MIPLERFLDCVRENASRIHAYKLRQEGRIAAIQLINFTIYYI